MRKLLKDNSADVKMVGAIVALLITLAASVLIFYNFMSGIDTTTIDANFGGANTTPAANATNQILNQAGLFYTIAPMIAIIIVAVVILAYIKKLGE